jgi:hypothetical protein
VRRLPCNRILYRESTAKQVANKEIREINQSSKEEVISRKLKRYEGGCFQTFFYGTHLIVRPPPTTAPALAGLRYLQR